jgi:hypothetical protein
LEEIWKTGMMNADEQKTIWREGQPKLLASRGIPYSALIGFVDIILAQYPPL